MVRRIEKDEALEALALNRRELGIEEGGCVMCALASGKGTPETIFETEDAVVVLDRFGARKGHLILIARQHIEDITALGRERHRRIFDLSYDACEALERALCPTRLFVASLGAPRAVPMSFPHFHLHLIPLFESDESTRPAQVFSWSEGVVTYDEVQAQKLAARIADAWPRTVVPVRAVASS